MEFVLFDKTAKVYAGLKGSKVVAVETVEEAVKFNVKKDNAAIKCRFYNAITGANFEAVNIK
jgi:hypothetical protein